MVAEKTREGRDTKEPQSDEVGVNIKMTNDGQTGPRALTQ
jgi:hypothetical protein